MNWPGPSVICSGSHRHDVGGQALNGGENGAAERLWNSGYPMFWTAWTVSEFGISITTTALQVLVVLTLHGSAADVGILNASRWLPYLLLGLVLGALVDRGRRKPILIRTDLGRGVLLGAVPLLWFVGWLNMPVLMAIMAAFGVLSLLNDSASQSFLPRLVPKQSLLSANARLDQSGADFVTHGMRGFV